MSEARNAAASSKPVLAGASERSVVDMSIGGVGLAPDQEVRRMAAAALLGRWAGYVDPAGILALRKAIAGYMQPKLPYGIDDANVLITSGATFALHLIYRTLSGPVVLVPDPGFPLYNEALRSLKMQPVPYRVPTSGAWDATISDIRKGIDEGAKALVWNAPLNPTGAVVPFEVAEEVRDICVANGVVWIADAVYDEFLLEPSKYVHPDIAEPELCFVVHSFSKSFGLAGFRVGFLIHRDKTIIDKLASLHWQSTMSVNWIGQEIALAYLNLCEDYAARAAEAVRSRQHEVCQVLEDRHIKFVRPDGGIFVCVDTDQFGVNALDLASMIRRDTSVLVTPCTAFGAGGSHLIRVNLAVEKDDFEKGSERLVDYLNGLDRLPRKDRV